MFPIGLPVLTVKLYKQDPAAADLFIFRLRVDHLARNLDQVIVEAQGNAQLLARFKELPGFQAQPIIADVEGAGEAAASHLTGVTKNFIIEKTQGITTLSFSTFKQFILHPRVSSCA